MCVLIVSSRYKIRQPNAEHTHSALHLIFDHEDFGMYIKYSQIKHIASHFANQLTLNYYMNSNVFQMYAMIFWKWMSPSYGNVISSSIEKLKKTKIQN